MLTFLLVLGGIIGGLISAAFLVGVLLISPPAFFVIMLIGWGAWKLAAPKQVFQEPQHVYYQPTTSSLNDPEEEF